MARNGGGGANLVFGDDTRKVQPKARMVTNGSQSVNAIRAGCSASVKVTEKVADECACGLPLVSKRHLDAKKKTRGKLKGKIASDVRTSVFIRTAASSGSDRGKRTGIPQHLPKGALRRGNVITAELTLAELKRISKDPSVQYIELGDPLKPPTPTVENRQPKPPGKKRTYAKEGLHHYGTRVLIGIIDVQGFDFAHPEFMRGGSTRFVRIWDQGGEGKAPRGFDYGNEITAGMMKDAIATGKELGAPATMIEKQSQMAVGSHGTHVASIAAGEHGICRNAAIAGVLIHIPAEESDRRSSFYDSTRVAHAVDWLIRISEEKDEQGKRKYDAVSINISLGTNGHAHDASASISRWIDHAMAIPGRCVSVAAGNAGQEASHFEGDIGFVMGRIHTSGTVAAKDLHQDIDWIVAGNEVVDISENELELWYGPQDRFAVQVRPPGCDWLKPVEPREFMENLRLDDPRLGEGNGSMVSIYNELYHPANGANYISIYLTPFLSDEGVIGVPAGTWMVRLIGRDVRDGRYHGWIERDDPRPLAQAGEKEQWAFPSFFGPQSNVDDSSVSSLACGRFIISVANLDEIADRIAASSSQGPTRDGRFKPDIAAPGTNIVAAKGFSTPGDAWISMSGTSMASPYVCGVAGLMLAVNADLTSSQIEGIMQRTAQPLPGATFAWKNDSGFGRINADRCLEEAALVHERKDRTR